MKTHSIRYCNIGLCTPTLKKGSLLSFYPADVSYIGYRYLPQSLRKVVYCLAIQQMYLI